MHRRIESQSELEQRLATTLLADLIEREADDYDSIEVIRDVEQTHRFSRVPVRPSKLLRTMDETCSTTPFVRYSEPYDRVELDAAPAVEEEDDGVEIPMEVIEIPEYPESEPEPDADPDTTAFPRFLVANGDLVAIDAVVDESATVVVMAESPAAIEAPSPLRFVVTVVVLLGAFALGISIPFLAS